MLLTVERGPSELKQAIRTATLGPGIRVPYPEPTSAAATAIGRANQRTGTACELAVRSALHRRGLRYRVDRPLRVGDLRVRPDVTFPVERVALFVDGCFWHGCPLHQHVPRSNTAYWVPKLAANEARDRRVDEALGSAGWLVIRVWEHEDPEAVARRVEVDVRARRPATGGVSHPTPTVPADVAPAGTRGVHATAPADVGGS